MFDFLVLLLEAVNRLRAKQPFTLPGAFLNLRNGDLRIGIPPAGELLGSYRGCIRDVLVGRDLDNRST